MHLPYIRLRENVADPGFDQDMPLRAHYKRELPDPLVVPGEESSVFTDVG